MWSGAILFFMFIIGQIIKTIYIMKGLIKNSGLLLVLIGAIILMVCAFTGNVNNNAILGLSTALVIVGLIVYIVVNKYIQD